MAYENGATYWICPVDNIGVALSVRGDSQVSQNRDRSCTFCTLSPQGIAQVESTIKESSEGRRFWQPLLAFSYPNIVVWNSSTRQPASVLIRRMGYSMV